MSFLQKTKRVDGPLGGPASDSSVTGELDIGLNFSSSTQILRMNSLNSLTLKHFGWRLDLAGQRLSTELDAALDIFCKDARLALKRFREDLEISAERFIRDIGRGIHADNNRNLEEAVELFKAKQSRVVELFCSELDKAVRSLKKASNDILDEFIKTIHTACRALFDETRQNLTIKIPSSRRIPGGDNLSKKSFCLTGQSYSHVNKSHQI